MIGVLLPMAMVTSALPPFRPASREFRAVWVATVDNIDWPSKRTLATDQQKAELLRIFEVADRAGLNAVVFQIRPSCDSLYFSKLEPWSEYLTGRQGSPPEPYWDPLEFAIEQAHMRGMELHAWFNPYRAKHYAAKGPLADNHIFHTRPDLAKVYGRYLWMDPGMPDTPKTTLNVMLDVVRRYDLDGVHIDDYFYPYAEKDAAGAAIPFPDDASYQAYIDRGGTLDRKSWRRKNVNDFVQNMYKSVKAAKPWVKVGISPFGIARPNQPEGIKAGIDQYDDPLYADCRLWFQEGWCDYFTPQLYWKLDSPGQPYGKLLQWWAAQNGKKRHLWPGNYTSRIMKSNGDWPVQEILAQIQTTRATKGSTGNVHFSMKPFLTDDKGITTQLGKGPYKTKAIVPASAWLGAQKPPTPTLKRMRGGGEVSLAWSAAPQARFHCLYRLQAGQWTLTDVMPAETEALLLSHAEYGKSEAYALTTVSKTGVESLPSILRR